MLAFMIVAYLILGGIALLLLAMGASIGTALLIFVYPTALFAVYIYFELKYVKNKEKAREETERRMDMYQASLNIIRLSTTNNDQSVFSIEALETLEEDMKAMGLELKCDMRGYMT